MTVSIVQLASPLLVFPFSGYNSLIGLPITTSMSDIDPGILSMPIFDLSSPTAANTDNITFVVMPYSSCATSSVQVGVQEQKDFSPCPILVTTDSTNNNM